jgi:hypothetical protein
MSEHFFDPPKDEALITRRAYLTVMAYEAGASWLLADETVDATALEHPEWDMSERRPWSEWSRG